MLRLGKESAVPVSMLNPPGDWEVLRTFHVARTQRGTDTVNQLASMSIDPSALTCLSCSEEHPILGSAGRPIIVAICYQNFVPVWPSNGCGSCIAIVCIKKSTCMNSSTCFSRFLTDRDSRMVVSYWLVPYPISTEWVREFTRESGPGGGTSGTARP